MDRREILKGAGVFVGLSIGNAGADVNALAKTEWPGNPRPKPYDPVAVLEAISQRFGVHCSIGTPLNGIQFWPQWRDDPGDESSVRHPGENYVPDFPSAVRWLHEQAAAVDAEFAKAWPVPE